MTEERHLTEVPRPDDADERKAAPTQGERDVFLLSRYREELADRDEQITGLARDRDRLLDAIREQSNAESMFVRLGGEDMRIPLEVATRNLYSVARQIEEGKE